ncbi:hypothetical protein LXA43DRAFT_976450 [Ganoderma leucocontextum]|nr:hypothetical protein LXA43DRAFT_976450 [Ganoderma leucocontextum]
MTEIGGPQACAYLLGQPDRYTDQLFKVFYWHSYCQKVASDVADTLDVPVDMDLPNDECVVLGLADHGVIERSKVDDYVFRPTEFSDWSLYDFLRLIDVRKLQNHDQSSVHDDHVDIQDVDNMDPIAHSDHQSSSTAYTFQHAHLLRMSHAVFLRKLSKPYILNFTGGTLPRRDKGDREAYCSAMLTFFMPWRDGTDLRTGHDSWDAAFSARSFTDEELQLMKNMNVKALRLFGCPR